MFWPHARPDRASAASGNWLTPGVESPDREPRNTMEDIEERVDDEEVDEAPDAPEGEAEEAAPSEEPAARRQTDADGGDVESIEELIVKKEAQAAEEDEEEDTVLALTKEERLEPIAEKVVPPQSSEFVCKKCYLVKHRSQLKDKKRMLCRDCA